MIADNPIKEYLEKIMLEIDNISHKKKYSFGAPIDQYVFGLPLVMNCCHPIMKVQIRLKLLKDNFINNAVINVVIKDFYSIENAAKRIRALELKTKKIKIEGHVIHFDKDERYCDIYCDIFNDSKDIEKDGNKDKVDIQTGEVTMIADKKILEILKMWQECIINVDPLYVLGRFKFEDINTMNKTIKIRCKIVKKADANSESINDVITDFYSIKNLLESIKAIEIDLKGKGIELMGNSCNYVYKYNIGDKYCTITIPCIYKGIRSDGNKDKVNAPEIDEEDVQRRNVVISTRELQLAINQLSELTFDSSHFSVLIKDVISKLNKNMELLLRALNIGPFLDNKYQL